MGTQKLEPFSAEISPAEALSEQLELTSFFENLDPTGPLSPIDRYLENTNRLNKILLDNRSQYTNELGTLLLLGYVSAVESYLRGIIRGLVQVDECVARLVSPLQVTYFAALHHEKTLLPEALLEGVSFISQANISKTLKEFCGISGMGDGSVPKSLEPIFQKYNQICQLRHCCVHRFGLLGADNARRLNLPANYLEKPITILPPAIEEVSIILEKFVSSLNSYIYTDVLQRSLWLSKSIHTNLEIKYISTWNLDFLQDETRFARYYDLFAITKSQPSSPSLWEEYNGFLAWAKDSIATDTIMIRNKLAKKPEKTAKPDTPLAGTAQQTRSEAVRNAEPAIHDDKFKDLPPAAADILAAAAAE